MLNPAKPRNMMDILSNNLLEKRVVIKGGLICDLFIEK